MQRRPPADDEGKVARQSRSGVLPQVRRCVRARRRTAFFQREGTAVRRASIAANRCQWKLVITKLASRVAELTQQPSPGTGNKVLKRGSRADGYQAADPIQGRLFFISQRATKILRCRKHFCVGAPQLIEPVIIDSLLN